MSEDLECSQDPLTIPEAFFLATLGGAQVLGLGETIGNFVVGKDFGEFPFYIVEMRAILFRFNFLIALNHLIFLKKNFFRCCNRRSNMRR